MKLKVIEQPKREGDNIVMQYSVVNQETGEPIEGICSCKPVIGTEGERMLTLATRLFSIESREAESC